MTRIDIPRRPLQRRSLLTTGLLLVPLAMPLGALASDVRAPSEVALFIEQPRLQGSGRLRFFGLHVYDARLWVGAGFRAENYARSPLALEIEYARELYGRRIAERTLDEMRRLDDIDERRAQAWLAELSRIFPDVAPGHRITGVQQPGEAARFFLNGRPLGQLRDPDFTRLFFGIWLSPRTSEPSLRDALIGGGRST